MHYSPSPQNPGSYYARNALEGMVVGNKNGERSGDRIFLESIVVNFRYTSDAFNIVAPTQYNPFVRFLVMCEKTRQSIAPASVFLAALEDPSIVSFYDYTYRDRITPLFDKLVGCAAEPYAAEKVGATSTLKIASNYRIFSYKVPVRRVVIFKPNTSGSDWVDIQSNAVAIGFLVGRGTGLVSVNHVVSYRNI